MAKRKTGLGSDPFRKDKGLEWIGGGLVDGHPSNVQQAPRTDDGPRSVQRPSEPEKAWGTGGTSEEGLDEEWKRHAFHVRKRFVKQLKLRATLENRDIKEVLDDALRQYLD